MKQILSLLLLSPLLLISCSSQNTRYISSVHDGDTFTDAKGVVYRLYGVDTAEVSDQYHNFKPTEGIEAIYGEEATELARGLILKHNCIVKDITMDPYERQVASISYQGKDLATELIKNGLARVAYMSIDIKNQYYTTQYDYYKSLLDAQYEAYKDKKGIWQRTKEMAQIFPKAQL